MKLSLLASHEELVCEVLLVGVDDEKTSKLGVSLGSKGCGPELGKMEASLNPRSRSMCTFLLASFSRSSQFGKLSHPAQPPFHKRQALLLTPLGR